MDDIRLQVPGGSLTVQDLRDLVGWAGASQARTFRFGDAQDLILEAPESDPGPAPRRFRRGPLGSLQSSSFGEAPTPSLPWLTAEMWMDLVAALPDPGDLDVQILHPPFLAPFTRLGHLRLTARKAPHQWEVRLRRPGSSRLIDPGYTRDTGALPDFIAEARDAWDRRDERFWRGDPAEIPAPDGLTDFREGREGFHRIAAKTFSFGCLPPSGRMTLERLRDLTWLAAETGASRVWITPERILLFEGLPAAKKRLWQEWLVRSRLPEVHGDLDRAVVAAGWSARALEARDQVLANLRQRDRMPPGRRILVADEVLNRGDGVCAFPYPVLIQASGSWLFRSADGKRSGEGTLGEVLDALEDANPALPDAETEPETVAEPTPASGSAHRCRSCLTVYDPRYGDSQAGVKPGIAMAELPLSWGCPVCGGSREQFSEFQVPNAPMRQMSHG